MLVVGCHHCKEIAVLAGTADPDGVARVCWTCRRCGAGQAMQLGVIAGARGRDLREIVGGFSLSEKNEKVSG